MLPLGIIDLQRPGEKSEKLQSLISSLGSVDRTADESQAPASKFWKYTAYPDTHTEQNWFSGFVDRIVEDGQAFVHFLNKTNPINEPCINICVLGDASEVFTLTIFSAVAAIIKKEKPLIVPDHVQQGINVLGMLYVPSNVNTLPFLRRQGVLRCMNELQVQRKVGRSGGYDKVMLYQDTQHRTEKFYPLLTPEQQAEYVFQCLVHLYYICDSLHPLLDGSNANDDFYFSMGAGSLYYDTKEQDERDAVLVGNSLVECFKKRIDSSKMDDFIKNDLDVAISPEELLSVSPYDGFLDPRAILKDSIPHPVNDFASLYLKKRFYGEYLQHYVENYQKQLVRKIAHASQNELLDANERMREKEEKIVKRICSVHIPQLIRSSSDEVGSLSLIESNLGSLAKRVTEHKTDLKDKVETCFWYEIESYSLDSRFKDAYSTYHAAFLQDGDKATTRPACEELKKEKAKELTEHLKNDATVLSRMVRAFLAGIVTVLAFMPVLETISPRLINLGDVAHNPFFYAFSLFLLPAIIEAVRFWRYHRKRKRLENELAAYYLHDSYARLANRQYNKINQLYDHITSLIEKLKKRCELIRADEDFFRFDDNLDLVLPRTMFNRPVIAGEDDGPKFFEDGQQNHNVLLIDIDRVKIKDVTEIQQYFLINKFYDCFSILFKDVLSDDELENYQAVKKEYIGSAKPRIKELFVERDDSTVGEKLDLYRRTVKDTRGFELFSRFNATNGEFTADDNESFADVKSNSSRMKDAFGPFLPLKTSYQVIGEDDKEMSGSKLFKNYLFLTRWRTFNYITSSRVLPEIEVEDRDFLVDYGFGEGNRRPVASIVLYSILGNLSSEWYTLFDTVSIDRLQTRVFDRKRGGKRGDMEVIIEKLKEQKEQEHQEEMAEQEEKAKVRKQRVLLEEGTIPYYDYILDTKED